MDLRVRYQVWPGHRPAPQIVAPLRREHAGQIVFPFDVSGAGRKELVMETITLRCAFLDVHKESIKACVRRMEPDHRLHQETHHWER